jgi:hypothetical protein
MRSTCCLCVCVSSILTFECQNHLYETYYVHLDVWVYLNGMLHKSFISLYVCMWILLSLLGNGCVKCLLWHRIHTQQ